jgi:excisionase family DNA binding protein
MIKQDLSTTEAAEILKVSKRTILNMIERGSINAQKLDPSAKSVYRIPHTEIERILRERAKPRDQRSGK